jgi:uncharacterized protein (TIGR00255 family)
LIQSMTGYAEQRFETPLFSGKISIKSLNHRYFDWHYRGSPIGSLETRLRTICQKRLQRGRIEVSLDLVFLDTSGWDYWINEEMLKRLLSTLEKLFVEKREPVRFSLDNIFAIPHAVEVKRKDFTEQELAFLTKEFQAALEAVIKVRLKEGHQLERKIRGYVQNIKRIVKRLEKLARNHPLDIRSKLEQRLKEMDSEGMLSEEKLAEETAYLAQRYDLTEEVTRLRYHLDYVEELLSAGDQEPVGKKLDFLSQEIYREANTINSKAQDIKIIKESLAVKSEVENIRQQAQNIE